MKQKSMKAVILAGGRGSRLGDYTREIPKPMITIGDRPLLHHQVDLLLKYGITEIIILVNYLKEPITTYFGDGKKFGASISYYEEKEPLGTTGGIKAIEDILTQDFMVIYGDVMINLDLDRLIRFHFEKNSRCTLVLHPNDHPYDSDLVEMNDEDRIIAFHSKPHTDGTWYHNLVNAGLYILSPQIFPFIEKGKKADFGKDVFPCIFERFDMYGYHTSEYLKDMGTPDRLAKVNRDLESGRIRMNHYEYKQKAVFLDRDGVLNTERSYISKPEELEIYDFSAAAVRKINQSGFLSVVVTNQSAIARNLCTEEDVQTIHKKLETVLGQNRAWLDAIYYCPHHPDKGFPEENPVYKIECDCRKPAIGMFRKAILKFNIDPELSYMIGDSERDILAGMNAGCTTVGVRTGYGVKKSGVQPDFTFENLQEAVNFITDDPYKDLFAHISKTFSQHAGALPFIILIGGNARSGKSTLASSLRIAFERSGHKTLKVSLDNWLLNEDQRLPEMNVYDRFQLITIERDMNRLLSGQSLLMYSYVNHQARTASEIEYNPRHAEIIIIEGVVALSSDSLRRKANIRLFTHADDETYRKRFFEYYAWRGKSAEDTAELLKKRESDEYQLIEKESKLADLIINSSVS